MRDIKRPLKPLAYSIRDWVELSGCSRSATYNRIKAGDLRVVKLGGRTLIPASEAVRLFGEPEAV